MLIACPTCGRLQFDMDSVVAEVERRLADYDDPIEVSVLGCAVNGIGEARHADFGITGAKDMGMIYSRGEPIKKVRTEDLVDELFVEIDKYYAAGKKVSATRRDAAEAARVAGRERGRDRDDARAHRGHGGGGRTARRGSLTGRGPSLHAGLTTRSGRARPAPRTPSAARPHKGGSRNRPYIPVSRAGYSEPLSSLRRTPRPPWPS